jgi:diaminopimelate epimerase
LLLIKSHALGNDYLVLAASDFTPSGARVRLLCDRHLGIGADGLLVEVPSSVADAGLRIFNPDGSEAEKSGNGLRIFARWLHDHRGAGTGVTVELAGFVVAARVLGRDVSVDMGEPTFVAERIPARWEGPEGGALLLDPCPHPAIAVGMGNPHCVVFVEDPLDELPWRSWGQALERHPRFPNRSNVQFARVQRPDLVEMRVWERGAGETLASGSSACAVVAAGRATGRLKDRVTVRMPGGELLIRATRSGLEMTGPVVELASLELSPDFLALLLAL